MKNYLLVLVTAIFYNNVTAQTTANVDFEAYLELAKEVSKFRKDRLIDFNRFLKLSEKENVIILDARSKEMYDGKHIKESINLNFSDFTQNNLTAIIPNNRTKILIYCNNNIANDERNFAGKIYIPEKAEVIEVKQKSILLALNTPIFITLYGYGYKNVYELSELVSVNDSRMIFEGTEVPLSLEVGYRIKVNKTLEPVRN